MDSLRNIYHRHITLFNVISLLAYFYLFLFSVELMGTSLKMLGKGLAETLITTTTNPLIGLFVGILSTSIIQSSSFTTSMVVGLVAGGALNVANAIPIIMGANIGTSVTNILVSLTQIRRSVEFRLAFAAAIVHDFFNVLAVIILFPLQYFTNFLGHLSAYVGEKFQHIGGLEFLSPVKASTKPIVEILKGFIGNYPWILFALSLIFLFTALTRLVKTLKILVVQKADVWFDRYLFKNAGRAFLVGIVLTALVQSSSVTTSLAVPLAGAGILTLVQIFPYTLGANIGTTVTAMLAALVTGNLAAVVVAFSHLIFNISGIVFWWPFKFVPITLAEKFSQIAMRKKVIPILYIIIVFFVIPVLLIVISR